MLQNSPRRIPAPIDAFMLRPQAGAIIAQPCVLSYSRPTIGAEQARQALQAGRIVFVDVSTAAAMFEAAQAQEGQQESAAG